ncbi:MAG: ATP-binding cassette domain-containing protein [Chloroflexi bacterium]|nr:ATP-binding cassette domain-containing protein [Chloroflexota bacterium]
MQDYVIRVENLLKKFGEVVAINDISFNVAPGEVFGFLGPNGAGKTTTINILCTLAKPTSGHATLNGFDVVRQQSQVRQSIGLVFQDPSLDERLSGLQNLRFHAMVYNIPAAVRETRIKEMLTMVELWDKRNSQVRTYSGGMKRRLEIARGLLHYPVVLFLDEPTLGLDPQTRSRIWEYILGLREQRGTTIFLTTHYMDEAEKADRIAVIDYGNLIAIDTPQGLKGMVGKDVISARTDDDDRAAEELRLRYGIEPRHDGDELTFEVTGGDEFLPVFIRELGVKIHSVRLRRPTLDDVFLKLTGREIREKEAGDIFKAMVREHGRRMRR